MKIEKDLHILSCSKYAVAHFSRVTCITFQTRFAASPSAPDTRWQLLEEELHTFHDTAQSSFL